MTSLGFENYAEALKIYLSKYREVNHPESEEGSPSPGLEDNPFETPSPALMENPFQASSPAQVENPFQIPSQSGAMDMSDLKMLMTLQTQSARGENQRPPSAGYGAGGPVGAPGGAGPARATGFPDPDATNPMMNPNLDPSEQDASAYGYPAMVGQPHNGAGGGPY